MCRKRVFSTRVARVSTTATAIVRILVAMVTRLSGIAMAISGVFVWAAVTTVQLFVAGVSEVLVSVTPATSAGASIARYSTTIVIVGAIV